MTKRFVLLFFTLHYLKSVQFYRRIFLKLTQLVLFSLASYPVVKIERLNLFPAVVTYTALSSAVYQKFDDFGIGIQTKLFLHEICAL
jgi:hypothetical protein